MKMAVVEKRIDNLLETMTGDGKLELKPKKRLCEIDIMHKSSGLFEEFSGLVIDQAKKPQDKSISDKIMKNRRRSAVMDSRSSSDPIKELEEVKSLYAKRLIENEYMINQDRRQAREDRQQLSAKISSDSVKVYRSLLLRIDVYGRALKELSNKKHEELLKGKIEGLLKSCQELLMEFDKHFRASKEGLALFETGILEL